MIRHVRRRATSALHIYRRPSGRFLGLALALTFVALLAVGGRDTQAQPVDLGEENSWIRIQNLGGLPAEIDISFYDLAGREVATDSCPSANGCGALPPGFGWSFFQQGLAGLDTGYRGSAFVTVDQPFVALLARDVFKDGAFQISGDSLRLGTSSSQLFAPIVQNNARYVSRLSVENTSDTSDACVEIRYYRLGRLEPATVDPPGPTTGCPLGGHLVPPRGTLLRDEHNLPVAADFDGSAVVRMLDTASGVSAAAQQPSLIVDTRDRTAPGLATYRGITADELSTQIVLPVVDRNATEGQSQWTTRFRILNGNPSEPNEVTLLFAGSDEDGNRVEIEHTVTVLGSLVCDQAAAGAAGCLPSDARLPAVFFGSVRMLTTNPIAVVAQRVSSDGSLADYRGFTAEEASREVMLPVLNKNFGPWGDAQGWNSWFRLLSFDGTPARVNVVYYSKHFPNGLVSQTFTVDPQRTMRQWEEPRIPDGWVGSAIVIADRPIVVIANLESDVFEGDPVMLYNGVSVD